jgi:hypothetical protein
MIHGIGAYLGRINIMKAGLTKLKIKIESPPISIFECKKGEKDIDRTGYFEHALSRQNHMYFMVPDGTYLVTQGNLSAKPCIYMVKDGEITQKPVTSAPIGNVVEELTTKHKEADKKSAVKLSDIMHTTKK